jgi:hypothetical protein
VPLLPRPLRAFAWLCAAAALVGCGGSATSGKQVKVHVASDVDANDRRPFYVLVRNVNEKSFLEEPYQTVAGKVMTRDDSVLDATMVFPGATRTITVDKPKKGDVSIYFLLTKPAGEWKSLLIAPVLDEVLFTVEGSRVRRKGDR